MYNMYYMYNMYINENWFIYLRQSWEGAPYCDIMQLIMILLKERDFAYIFV